MTRKTKNKKRLFSGLGYRDVQKSNSIRRGRLSKDKQKWLKDHHYKNVGWDNVIALYQKINEFIADNHDNGETLEELFLAADRIGNKYQAPDEIASFQKQLSQEVERVSEKVDKQFPEVEFEFVDFR